MSRRFLTSQKQHFYFLEKFGNIVILWIIWIIYYPKGNSQLKAIPLHFWRVRLASGGYFWWKTYLWHVKVASGGYFWWKTIFWHVRLASGGFFCEKLRFRMWKWPPAVIFDEKLRFCMWKWPPAVIFGEKLCFRVWKWPPAVTFNAKAMTMSKGGAPLCIPRGRDLGRGKEKARKAIKERNLERYLGRY